MAASAGSALMAAKAAPAKGGTRDHFIKTAIKHAGSLHRALGVPVDQKIPASKLAAAANSSDTDLKRKVDLAKTLEGFH